MELNGNIPRWVWISFSILVVALIVVSFIAYNAYNKKVSPSNSGGVSQRTSLDDLENDSTQESTPEQPPNVFDYAHAIVD